MHIGEWCPKNTQEKKFNTVYNKRAEKGLRQAALKPGSLLKPTKCSLNS